MESTMETCPNCGAVARPGAKYCTICGTRLRGGEVAPSAPAAPASASGSSTVTATEPFTVAPTTAPAGETASWAWGATPSPAPDPEAPSATTSDATNDHDHDHSAGTWPVSATAPTALSASTTGEERAPGDVDTSSALVDAPATALTAPDDDADGLSSWAARWNADAWSGPDSGSGGAAQGEEAAGVEGALAGMPTPSGEAVPDDLPVLPDTGAIDLPEEEPGDPGFTGIEGAPAGDPDALAVTEEIAQDGAPAGSGDDRTGVAAAGAAFAARPARPVVYTAIQRDAHERAARLVDELRGLMPQLIDATGDGTPAPATVRAVLSGALGTRTDDAALRKAVRQAEANPRDLYAMMDLGRQVGTISALIEERDRLRAAVEEAIDAIHEPES